MTLVRTLLFRDRLPQHSPSPDEELPLSKWLPETIRARRKASDLSMEKLSAASDLCRMTLHCLETGKNRPTLPTVDVVTKESTVSFKERTDVTAVPAAGVVAETMVALVLATEAQRKFGGDSISEFVRNAESFRATLP